MDYTTYFKRMPLWTLKQVKKNAEDAIGRPESRFYERCVAAHPFICREIEARRASRRLRWK